MKHAILLLLIALLFMQCGDEATGEEKTARHQGTPVKVEMLAKRSFANYLQITGTVHARNHIMIMVEEAGLLRRVLVDRGERARAGQTLAVLENKPLEASFKQAQAALDQAELDYKSKEVLYGRKAISENDFLTAQYSLASAKAAFELAEARYKKLFVSAPISGLINERYYDVGAYGSMMTPIFELIDNQVLKIRAGIAERFMGDISVGTPAEIRFDAYPDMLIEAKISYVSRSINPQSRTFEVEVEIPNSDGKLAPQMIANLKIVRQQLVNRIVVPLDAMMESERGWHVYVAEGTLARERQVEKMSVYQDKVLVEGLNAGEKLIVMGQHELADGDTLMIVE